MRLEDSSGHLALVPLRLRVLIPRTCRALLPAAEKSTMADFSRGQNQNRAKMSPLVDFPQDFGSRERQDQLRDWVTVLWGGPVPRDRSTSCSSALM